MGKLQSHLLLDESTELAWPVRRSCSSSFLPVPKNSAPKMTDALYPTRKGFRKPQLDWAWSVDSGPGEDDQGQPVNLYEDDQEKRRQAQTLLTNHSIPEPWPEEPDPDKPAIFWRCVPMEQMDPKGYEGAVQSGAAPISMRAGGDGRIGIQVPKTPPIFNPPDLESDDKPPPGGKTPKGLKGEYTQILRDPGGTWYWVYTAEGKVPRSKEALFKFDSGPAEQPIGTTMMCKEGEQKWDVQSNGHGLFELEKRTTNFLALDRPIDLKPVSR